MSSFCPVFLRQPPLLSSECKPPHRGGRQRGSLLSTWLCSGSLAYGRSPAHAESRSSRGQGRAHTRNLSAPRLSSPFPHMPAAVVDAVLILVLLASKGVVSLCLLLPPVALTGPPRGRSYNKQKTHPSVGSPSPPAHGCSPEPFAFCPVFFYVSPCYLKSEFFLRESLLFGRGAVLM